LFVDPENPDDLAEKLAAVLTDTALHNRLVTAGRQRADELSWRRTAEQTYAVYERVAARR
jgi:alpha-1,3-rhamnosyl/mannosyltransferase